MYLSFDRFRGDIARYIWYFRETHIFFNLIPKECNSEARKILCHYYLPTCGNSTVFKNPTSVCQDVCMYLQSLCPIVFEQLEKYFTSNQQLVSVGMKMINCSNTGDFISPLQHCCEDLDIEIRKLITKHSISVINNRVIFV